MKASLAALPFFRPRSLTNARIGVEQGDCNVGGEDYFVILKVRLKAFEGQPSGFALFLSPRSYKSSHWCGAGTGGADYFVILKVRGGSKLLKVSLAALTFFRPRSLTNARIRRARGRKKAILLSQNDLQKLWSG